MKFEKIAIQKPLCKKEIFHNYYESGSGYRYNIEEEYLL